MRQPGSEEVQHFGEFGRVSGAQGHLGYGVTASGWLFVWLGALVGGVGLVTVDFALLVRGTTATVSSSMTSRKLLFSQITVTVLPA